MKFTKKIMPFILLVCLIASSIALGEDLPETYDLRELEGLTPVKAQGGMGSCWALSSMASLESYLALKGESYDFSEAHLIGLTSETYDQGFDRSFDGGGDAAMATAYYTSWKGPILETDQPYPESGMSEDYVFGHGEVIKHVQEVLFVDRPISPLENDSIKKLIMTYGAIDVPMWKGSAQTFGPYYDETHFAWYYPEETMGDVGGGHAVNIVGWDDHYPKENFKIMPPGDGAYIVQNTKGPEWGRPDRKNSMGGYFYISYYDGMLFEPRDSLVGATVITRVDDVNNYDRIYQYDDLGYTRGLSSKNSTIEFANIFEAGDLGQQTLEAVGFYTLEDAVEYEVWIKNDYRNFADMMKMTKVHSGVLSNKGYHTIDLNEAVELQGTKVAVAIKLIGDKPSVAVESSDGLNASQAVYEGTSYIKFNDSWDNPTRYADEANVCLKMYTSDDNPLPETLNTTAMMKKDVDFVVDWILNHQPIAKESGYTDEQEETIERVYESIKTPLSDDDFYFAINPLFTMMNDGHTILYDQLNDGSGIDLSFEWLNEGIVITKDNDYLHKGDEILSIGGITPQLLKEMLHEQISTENDYWVQTTAEKLLFRWPYLTYYELVNDDQTVTIEYRRGDQIKFTRLPRVDHVYYEGKDQPWYEWHLEENNNLGYLRFDSFASGDRFETILPEVRTFFEEVIEKDLDYVVIDLRDNGGGTAQILNVILSFLPEKTLYTSGFYPYNYYKQYQYSGQPTFNGQLYVLTGHDSFSCSVYATSILKDNGLAQTIGEPTGEMPAFNRHGNGSDGDLLVKGWPFMMTSVKGVRPMNKDATVDSIYPDVPVNRLREDMVTKRDRAMEKMRAISHGQLAYDKSFVMVDEGLMRIPLSLFKNNAFSSNYESLWVVSSIGETIYDVDVEDSAIVLPKNINKEAQYYLMMVNGQEQVMGSLFAFGESQLPPQDRGFLYTNYSVKFKYVHFEIDPAIIKQVLGSRVKLYDSKYQEVPYSGYQKVISSPWIYLFTPNSPLDTGQYSLEIMPGGVQYLDGSFNTETVILSINVK